MTVDSEAPSPKSLKRESNGGSLHIPQLSALGELEFKKAFLLLSYIPGKPLVEVITADEIRQWKDLPMAAYETAVWFRLGQQFCSHKERRAGPLLEHTATHLNQPMKLFRDTSRSSMGQSLSLCA